MMSVASWIASDLSIIEPRSACSASIFCGGTRPFFGSAIAIILALCVFKVVFCNDAYKQVCPRVYPPRWQLQENLAQYLTMEGETFFKGGFGHWHARGSMVAVLLVVVLAMYSFKG